MIVVNLPPGVNRFDTFSAGVLGCVIVPPNQPKGTHRNTELYDTNVAPRSIELLLKLVP